MRKLLPGVGVVQIGEWFAKKTPSRANGGTQGMMVNRVGGGAGLGEGHDTSTYRIYGFAKEKQTRFATF